MKSQPASISTKGKRFFFMPHRTTKNKRKNHGGKHGSCATYFMGDSFLTDKQQNKNSVDNYAFSADTDDNSTGHNSGLA